MAREVSEALGIMEDEALRLIRRDLTPDAITSEVQAKWRDRLIALLSGIAAGIYVQAGSGLTDDFPGVDPADLTGSAADWARNYAFDVVSQINRVTVEKLQSVISAAIENNWSIDRIREQLTPVFGPVRAEMISITETTRAAVQGELAIINGLQADYAARGQRIIPYWVTRPELSATGPCPLCEPLDGLAQGDGWFDPPPSPHPRCVCSLRYEAVPL